MNGGRQKEVGEVRWRSGCLDPVSGAAGKMQAGELIPGGVFTTATGGARLGSIFGANPFSW